MNKRHFIAAGLIGMTAGGFSPVHAQQAGASAASNDTGLEEIVVTAERREESSQHVAIPLSIVSADDIANANITRPEGLSQLVPALQVTDDTGPYSIFYVRGVGNYAANGLSDPALLFNFDGVAVGRAGTSGMFYDLDRVEVLKGPQGTLYGRNATGGAINVLSKQAELDKFSVGASLDVGNYSAQREEAMINVPLGDVAAVRFAGFHTQHDGYMSDGTDDQDDSGGRLSFKVVPSDTFKVTLVADYMHQGGQLSGGTITGVTSAFATPPSFSPGDRYGFFSPQVSSYLATQLDFLNGANFLPFQNLNHEDNTYWGVSSTIDWTTPIGTLTFVPAHRDSKLDYTSFATGVMLNEMSEDKQTTLEMRLASDTTHAFRYVIGAFYMDDPEDVPQYQVNQQANHTFQSYTTDTISKAAFANLTYAFVPELRLNVGARYTRDSKSFDGTSTTNTIICTVHNAFGLPSCPNAQTLPYASSTILPASFPPFVPGADGTFRTLSPIDNDLSQTYSKVTWRAGLDYDVSDHNLMYASVETGYKAGGFFFSDDTAVYKPETITAYTVGSKNRFLDNKVQANFEVFYWKYNNQQISHLSTDSHFITIFPTENVGESSIKGAEFDLQWRALTHTLVGADVQFNDAVYNSFVYKVPNNNGGFNNGTGCSGPLDATTTAFYTVDCSGKTPPYAPKWTLAGNVEQTIPLASGGKLVAGANVHYQSATLTALEFLPVETQAGYSMWNFNLDWSSSDEHFTAGAYVNNAFDKTALAFSFLTPFSQFSTATLQHPRTFGARVGVHF